MVFSRVKTQYNLCKKSKINYIIWKIVGSGCRQLSWTVITFMDCYYDYDVGAWRGGDINPD